MTIDERIDALTQSVELLAGMQRETERRFNQLIETLQPMSEAVTRLIAIAHDHEHRIGNLEDSHT